MAIAVPFIASALGASTMVSVGIGITFAVTGINDKINKAASKVFGEDLVNFANIAGMGYAMFNGGFDMGSGAEAAGAATDAAFEADFASASGTSGAMPGEVVNGNYFADVADTGGAGLDVADAMGASSESFNLQNMASNGPAFDPDLADVEMVTGKTTFSSTEPTNLLNGDTGLKDSKVFQSDPVAQTPTAQAITPQTNASAASATKAVTPTATAQQATAPTAPATAPIAPVSGDSNFSKLINKLLYNQKGGLNDRLIGGVLQGGGQVAASYLQRKAQQRIADEAQARKDALAPGRFY